MEGDEPMDTAGPARLKKKGKKKPTKKKAAQNGNEQEESSSVYIPGHEDMAEDEELVVDESAYVMLHEATTGDPCLSFEVLSDNLGENRENFPLTAYVIGGSQSEAGHLNCLMMMKMFNLHKTQKEKKEDDEEDSSSDDDDEDDEDGDNAGGERAGGSKQPVLQQTAIRHNGCVNRVKTCRINDHVISASWSENGTVYLFDVTPHINLLDDPDKSKLGAATVPPLFAFEGHQIEGYALAWSRYDAGHLLSGDCNKNIYKWRPSETAWEVDQRPFIGHTASVEDIKWSPKESNVFMSCSVDKSLRIWDARCNPAKACKLVATEAHLRDINVIDWSEYEPLVISGGDDGIIKIWDLRKFTSGKEVARFEHHKGPITSVEWNPHDSSVFVAAGSDDQVSIWDVAVERDDSGEEEPDVPPQLLFMHLGQKDIKEVHWHRQIPGLVISTAQSGFNVFRTISV